MTVIAEPVTLAVMSTARMKVWITSAPNTDAQSATLAVRLLGNGYLEPWGKVFAGTYRGHIEVYKAEHGFWGFRELHREGRPVQYKDDLGTVMRVIEGAPISQVCRFLTEFAIAAIRIQAAGGSPADSTDPMTAVLHLPTPMPVAA